MGGVDRINNRLELVEQRGPREQPQNPHDQSDASDLEERFERESAGSRRRNGQRRDRGNRNEVDNNLGSIKVNIPAFRGRTYPEEYLE